ncbi:MAG: ABC transporter ATP-binding protein [Pseudomonadota bacterium]
MSLLVVEDLNVRFRTDDQLVHAVRNIGFRLEARESLAIVGESGSGKSQTINSILGLLAENGRAEGSVRLHDKEILNLDGESMRKVRGRHISVVFQNPMTSLNPYRTIGYQLSRVLIEQRGLDAQLARAEVIRMLDAVRLPAARKRLNAHPHEFSGGMRQRVMIAAALLCRPDVLIADEPTSALDVTVQASILELLRELRESFNTAMILVSHDLAVVAGQCERLLVMDKGEFVEAGDTASIFSNPQHAVTRRLLDAVPRLDRPLNAPRPKVSDAEPILEAFGLSVRYRIPRRPGFRYRFVTAVRNIDLQLHAGESVGIVGESGCGKSSLARALLAVGPRSGGLRFRGTNIEALTAVGLRAFRRAVQLVFQDPVGSLNPRMTVADTLIEPMIVHDVIARGEVAMPKVLALLQRVGLEEDIVNRYPHECSGGQCQRIGIARALAASPKALICDEAVSALDVSVQADILALLRTLQGELKLGLLFIAHDLAVVRDLCERIIVMHAGQIVEQGPTAAVFSAPQHSYTRALIAAAPVLKPVATHAAQTDLHEDASLQPW